MQSQLIQELFSAFDSKIFNMAVQVIIIGAIGFYIKELSSRIVNFLKLRMSDLGRGTRITVLGETGKIERIGFSEVEVHLRGPEKLFLIPVDKFISSAKIIHMNDEERV